jgi:hypothetical protein
VTESNLPAENDQGIPFTANWSAVEEIRMYCPKGCTIVSYPQKMQEREKGHYICPQCAHEVKENDPDFKCLCKNCTGWVFP